LRRSVYRNLGNFPNLNLQALLGRKFLKRHVLPFSAFNSKVWVRVRLFGGQPNLETLPHQISESVPNASSTMFPQFQCSQLHITTGASCDSRTTWPRMRCLPTAISSRRLGKKNLVRQRGSDRGRLQMAPAFRAFNGENFDVHSVKINHSSFIVNIKGQKKLI
jgi:hypothetical protein